MEECCFIDKETGVTNDIYIPPESPWRKKTEEPVTTVMSRAMEYASQRGYKMMVALLDCNKGTMTKEDRLHTFTDIESKKLREVIYKEIEESV